MLSLRSVSPANQTPSTTNPSVSSSSARGPGRRRPSCQAGTTWISVSPTLIVSPDRTSRTAPKPIPSSSFAAPAGSTAVVSGPASAPQRRLVEMVVVQVRDEHAVEHARVRGVGAAARQVRDAAAQHGVGEQARAGRLEQHGGVPEPGDRHPARARRAHLGHVEILRMSLGASLAPARWAVHHPLRMSTDPYTLWRRTLADGARTTIYATRHPRRAAGPAFPGAAAPGRLVPGQRGR